MEYPPPPGLGVRPGPPRNVGFPASGSGYAATNEVRLGPQFPAAPQALPYPEVNPVICPPSAPAAPYPPAAGANQALYHDSSSRISMPEANTSPGFLTTGDRTLPQPSGVLGPGPNRYCSMTPNYPPVNYRQTHDVTEMPVPRATTRSRTLSGMERVASSTEALSPPGGFGPEQSGCYPQSPMYPSTGYPQRQGTVAMPTPELSPDCSTQSPGRGHAASSTDAPLTPQSPPSTFGPERTGYYPEPPKYPPVQQQPKHGIYAMPSPRLSTGYLTPSTVMTNAFPSMDALPATQPPPGSVRPERSGRSPTPSNYQPTRGQPRQGASTMALKGFTTACRSNSHPNTSRSEAGSLQHLRSSDPSGSDVIAASECKLLSDEDISNALKASRTASDVGRNTSGEQMRRTSWTGTNLSSSPDVVDD